MPHSHAIAFGTDGWRDIIGFGFHAEPLAIATRAYASHLRDEGASRIVVAHDTRFHGARFARYVADILAGEGFEVLLSDGPLPTPVLSFAVKHTDAAGGIMLTASHNPASYQGFKLKGPYGGTATAAIYESVTERLGRVSSDPPRGMAGGPGSVAPLEIRTAYYDALAGLVDVDVLKTLDGRVVHDAMGGAAGGWLAGFARHVGLPVEVVDVRGDPDPLFYGVHPEPLPANMGPVREVLREREALFATATDGDGDRLGVMLPDGSYFNSHQIFAVLLDLMQRRGAAGKVVKTFTVSRVIERLAERRGIAVEETPVGFKHLVDAFLAGGVMIAGEESGGIGVAGHLPERDGIVNSLLLLEAIGRRGAPLGEIFADLEREAEWAHAYDRLDLRLTDPARKEALMKELGDAPERIGSREVLSVERRDGIKLNLEGRAWLLFRPSGTEPLLRIYCEAGSQDEVRTLLAAAERAAVGEGG